MDITPTANSITLIPPPDLNASCRKGSTIIGIIILFFLSFVLTIILNLVLKKIFKIKKLNQAMLFLISVLVLGIVFGIIEYLFWARYHIKMDIFPLPFPFECI